MALKLHLLSNQAIENKTSDNFTEYNSIIKKSIYKLNDEQRKCFTNLSKKIINSVLMCFKAQQAQEKH